MAATITITCEARTAPLPVFMPSGAERREEAQLARQVRVEKRRALRSVIPGLVPGIQTSADQGVGCEMDPGNKCRMTGE
jgi:hypothetical protein